MGPKYQLSSNHYEWNRNPPPLHWPLEKESSQAAQVLCDLSISASGREEPTLLWRAHFEEE